MKIEIDLPDYDGIGVDVIWEENADYTLDVFDDEVVLKANREGLLSLGKEMIYFAENNLQEGSHIHYDSFFTGKDRDYALILEKDTSK